MKTFEGKRDEDEGEDPADVVRKLSRIVIKYNTELNLLSFIDRHTWSAHC